jgi:hypothetical protein
MPYPIRAAMCTACTSLAKSPPDTRKSLEPSGVTKSDVRIRSDAVHNTGVIWEIGGTRWFAVPLDIAWRCRGNALGDSATALRRRLPDDVLKIVIRGADGWDRPTPQLSVASSAV